jgi:hypothetical protein
MAKATGEGIGGVMRNGLAGAKADTAWSVIEVDDLPGYVGCVAAEGSGWRVVRRTVSALTEKG